jgi:hypothetical protein
MQLHKTLIKLFFNEIYKIIIGGTLNLLNYIWWYTT